MPTPFVRPKRTLTYDTSVRTCRRYRRHSECLGIQTHRLRNDPKRRTNARDHADRDDGEDVVQMLFISNGHGEDRITASILKAISNALNDEETGEHTMRVKMNAVAVVGEGKAYTDLDIPLVCRTEVMPSGGFIYQRPLHLIRDLKKGLFSLTIDQLRGIRSWIRRVAEASTPSCIIAVGDVVPLAMAIVALQMFKKRQSTLDQNKHSVHIPKVVFIGCAKSQYYLPADDREKYSVYYSWERWLMSRSSCKLIAPRDQITADVLRRSSKLAPKVQYLGNPMMDDFGNAKTASMLDGNYGDNAQVITLLPGTRVPELYRNLKLLLEVCQLMQEKHLKDTLVFILPIPDPSDRVQLQNLIEEHDWEPDTALDSVQDLELSKYKGKAGNTLLLGSKIYAESLRNCHCALAMAGTATEQCVGLGKPVVTIVGEGPQFNRAFAEAQARLLGEDSLKISHSPEVAVDNIECILNSAQIKVEAKDNGMKRMGTPGASRKIAHAILSMYL